MLGKLFKHELSETARLLFPLNLALILVALIGKTILAIEPLNRFSLINGLVVLVYMLTIFSLFLLTAVYLTVRFYKTMFASQGYLTHTLPVSTASVLNVKVTSASLWLCIAVAAAMLSLYILSYAGLQVETNLMQIKNGIETVSGMRIWQFWLFVAAMAVIICASNVLMVCASLSIGQLFQQYRIPAAIVAYVILYLIQQVVSVVMLGILGIAKFDSLSQIPSQMEAISYQSFYRWLFGLVILQGLVFAAAYYATCYYITKKKLNLE